MRPSGVVFAASVAAVVVAAATPAVDALNSRAYAIGDYVKALGSSGSISNTAVPSSRIKTMSTRDKSVFDSFYILMQRLHFMPVAADRLRELNGCDAIALINLARDVDEVDAVRLANFVARAVTSPYARD